MHPWCNQGVLMLFKFDVASNYITTWLTHVKALRKYVFTKVFSFVRTYNYICSFPLSSFSVDCAVIITFNAEKYNINVTVTYFELHCVIWLQVCNSVHVRILLQIFTTVQFTESKLSKFAINTIWILWFFLSVIYLQNTTMRSDV